VSNPDASSETAGRHSLADFARSHRSEILERWLAAVRECTPAIRLSEEDVLDHFPRIFDRLADSMEAIAAGRWGAISGVGADDHAIARLSEGFKLQDVVTEFFLLRHVLLEYVLAHRGPVPARPEEAQTLCWAIDAAIRDSVDAYTSARQRLLRALDRLSTAALESRSLGDLLPRLLHVVVDTTAEVDMAAFFLLEEDRLRLRAAVGGEERLGADFSLAVGEGFTGRVAAERRPVFLRSAATDPLIRSPVIRQLGTRALYGLPVIADRELLGVLHMGSITVSDFSERDKAFLRTIADRAGAAILQQKLRDEAERAGKTRDEALAVLDSIYAAAPIGVAFLDRGLRFVRVNEALAKLSGVPPEAHLGKRLSELPPSLNDVEEIEAGLRHSLQTGETRIDVEISGETPSDPGQPRHWKATWYPVRVRGEVAGVGVIAREVTREREEEQYQRFLMGIVGHDLRGPLSAIALSTDVLLKDEDLTERQAKLALRIHASAARLEGIAHDLLDLTRSRAGQRIPIDRRSADLSEIAREVIGEAEAANPGRRFVLEKAGDTAGDWDPARLAQALSNLVRNAAAYSPAGTPVVVRCIEERDGVSVEVENQGVPIDAELLAHIFEPFRRGRRPDARNRTGLGLGLFIAREIAHAHEGSISAASDERRTAFRISLPRRASEPAWGAPSFP
jgi:PAS domain S-box-containing protein